MSAAPYIEQNTAFYVHRFQDGYGHRYPESHVIKLYNRVLRGQLNLVGEGRSLLDFGCSTGCNLEFFAARGFDVYGIDISEVAIDHCRGLLPQIADHFAVIPPSPADIASFFDRRFDVVFSNQVLSLFSKSDFETAVGLMHDHLTPGGVVVASMAGINHYYYRHSAPAEGGLRRITLGDNPQDTLFMRFTASPDALKSQFRMFTPLFVGYYDINLCDDSGFHYVFVGRKEA